MSKTNDAILAQAEEQHQYTYHNDQWYRALVRKIWHLAGPYSFFKCHPKADPNMSKSYRQAIIKHEQWLEHNYDPQLLALAEQEVQDEMATRARKQQQEDPNWHAKTMEGRRRKKKEREQAETQAQQKPTRKRHRRKASKADNQAAPIPDDLHHEKHALAKQEAPRREIPVTVQSEDIITPAQRKAEPYINEGPIFLLQRPLNGAVDPEVIAEQGRRAVVDAMRSNAVKQLVESLEGWLDHYDQVPCIEVLNHFAGIAEDHTAERAIAILINKGYRFSPKDPTLLGIPDMYFICIHRPSLSWAEWNKQVIRAAAHDDEPRLMWLMDHKPKNPAPKDDIAGANPYT